MATAGKESDNGVYEFPYMRPENNLSKWQTFINFLWEPSTKKCLGRTGKSWAQITVFYAVFYTGLAALFAVCMQGLHMTLDDHRPKWLLDQSLIGTNPGLGFRPISDRTEEGSLIWYHANNETSVKKWTEVLDRFLEMYIDNKKLPGGGKNQAVCDFGKKASAGSVCAVDVDSWGACSSKHGYGFNKSAPCFFLKLNRIYGWVADYYNDTADLPEAMPQDLKDHIASLPEMKRNQIWVSCQGENPADVENIGPELEYLPTRGFPDYYYPYENVEGYLSPLVAVQIKRPKKHVLVNIECRAWAKNIMYRGGNQQREGSVHLEILVD